jgi:phosphohistidine phosphatase
MKLVVVRHAKSMDRSEFTGDDDWKRPISEEGRKEMQKVARGLHQLIPEVERFVSSPLKRAKQTGDIMKAYYEEKGGRDYRLEETETLIPSAASSDFERWLRENAKGGTMAVFGHKPSLPKIVSYLLSREDDAFISLKKGSACLVDISPGERGELQWLLAPKQLEDLGWP